MLENTQVRPGRTVWGYDMSVSAASSQRRTTGQRLRLVQPFSWHLWELPRPVLAYVLAVDVAALALVALTSVRGAVTGTDLVRFAVLSGAAVVHLEFARGIERMREMAVSGTPYVNLKSLWVFTGVVLLPLPLVAALTAITYLYAWARVDGQSRAHKKVFTAATFILASGGAAAVLSVSQLADAATIPTGRLGLLVLVAAAVTWWFVNFALVVAVLRVSNPEAPVRAALGDLADQLVVAAALGLGIGMAALLIHAPWLVLVLMVTVVVLHQQFLLPQLRRQVQTDTKTGLLDPVFFTRLATALLRRLREQVRPAALLMIDLDRFKRINDDLGHPAGDDAIQAAADVLRQELRGSDLVARFGGDEFVLLLPGVGKEQVNDISTRLLLALRTHRTQVSATSGPTELLGLPASVGVALYPQHGVTVDQLLLAADAAQQRAKQAGGAQVVVAPLPPAVEIPAQLG
ncbi:GGDEF domain-containing protein [Saccharothrix syringae]|uniref:GGDEF domain-containing protein n=1 Tax=Saccharothrix syringae TaxID=103733 RepID=UPI0014775B7D|nr:GGDEF domain-containing protein [Saccharothrix syringae]